MVQLADGQRLPPTPRKYGAGGDPENVHPSGALGQCQPHVQMAEAWQGRGSSAAIRQNALSH
eukprot:CAMPEP_0179058430 /NCGR_PEP_ID=MMETSP0796-20121207/24844_1 /TAXON_ID=73915 /ORGANISM="Pyrodinium bahamense, Strain pbaha01" /LENGTH=61 /DNA_ID=CAMNT_0020755177 /DNA_START=1121 /DNA_END=1303 /DNA_ORIENTATION=-